MPLLKSLEDLDRLRLEERRVLTEESFTGATFYVGMGTCGIAAGARDTFNAIQEELAKRRIAARVKVVGCVGMCSREPLVDIQRAGMPRVTYANVLPDKVPRLISEHLINGRPVIEWTVGRVNHRLPEEP